MQVIMLTYLTVTLTTLGVAHLVDDGLSRKVSKYFTSQLISLPIISTACGSCTVVLGEYPPSCKFMLSLYEWFSLCRLLFGYFLFDDRLSTFLAACPSSLPWTSWFSVSTRTFRFIFLSLHDSYFHFRVMDLLI